MMNTPLDIETVAKLWPIFVGVIIFVTWLIRLESHHHHLQEKVRENEKRTQKEFDDHKTNVRENELRVWEKFDTVVKQNNEILKSVSRLEGKLEKQKES
jgi:uncharacterized membrane-anchored protein YhcB (DUF1043 family)